MKKKIPGLMTHVLIGVCLMILSIALSSNAGAQDKLTPDVARNLATEAWLFGLPLVMFEKQIDYSTHVTQAEETRAPINQFVHYRKFVDASNRSVVGFNVDNLYSLAWIDLRAEPLVLAVPAMGNRYWMMQIVDAWNGVPAVPGSRTHSGDDPHVFLVAGLNWKGQHQREWSCCARRPTSAASVAEPTARVPMTMQLSTGSRTNTS